ncbi:lysine transporter LysE [Hahella sp. CCB-MM4]|uniref:LysE family translocator n=1 Tax=Hahella sp. (strain CCB-MM4) TaxID=1926491 RepID=UPI000B9A4DC6|nr:LysE family translocator [Hahella sp. CCB-MM4]OZG72193.1 lysine transporter LysE [Hahella sp. CCB-MM4]
MRFEIWLMFSLAYLVTTLSPGPNVLLVLKNSVQHGWKSAFITVLGNLSCQFIIVCLVAIGVGELLKELPAWFIAMKVTGGIYLIYLGVKSLRSTRKSAIDLPVDRPRAKNKSVGNLFSQAFLVSASNPKTLIFLSAFLPQFLDVEHLPIEQFSLMFISICVIVATVHLGYAYLINRIGQRVLTQDFSRTLSKVTGGLFITLGGGVLLSSRA